MVMRSSMEHSLEAFCLPKSVTSVADLYRCDIESVASSATSKHLIDQLFCSDQQSVLSEYGGRLKRADEFGGAKSLADGISGDSADDEDDVKNDVQVRIEKMFSEVSGCSAETDELVGASSSAVSMSNRFAVAHLGSLPVRCKITSVDGLQDPLRELFFKYCSAGEQNANTGFVQISDQGLLIEYAANNLGGVAEKLNPFSTIAIWASLRFSKRTEQTGTECAFLPIVANSDKTFLYHKVDKQMVPRISHLDNTPLFVVVMREPDTPTRQLVCHGFICDSSEDAVIMAATLYRVLMSKLGKNRVLKSNRNHNKRKTKSVTSRLCSIDETSPNEANESAEHNYSKVCKPSKVLVKPTSKPPPPPPPPPLPPSRPPRKIKESPRSSDESVAVATAKDSVKNADCGDVLTKVAIPRSSSFLNTNKLASRYDLKVVERVEPTPKGSPLGFVEMFNELQSQEGLETVDQILNVIIKEEGMSFNDLKPIYKEFLMKLALVLSKDELYYRSKSIMKSQKKKKESKLKKVIRTKNGLKNALKRPLMGKVRPTKVEAAAVPVACLCNASPRLCSDGTSTDSFFMTDSKNVATSTAAERARAPVTKNFSRHKTFRLRSRRVISTSEDSDYPNMSRRRWKSRGREEGLRPSSSGYFSFSECSYDTESCTCTSADKCYCSLSKTSKTNALKKCKTFTMCSCDTLDCRKRNKCYCAAKTTKLNINNNSNSNNNNNNNSSNNSNTNLSLVEQLKQKGFAVSESSLSPDDGQPMTLAKDRYNSKLSKSLEYLENLKKYKNRMEIYDSNQKAYACRQAYKYSPSYSSCSSRTSQRRSSSSDNLAVDYSLFAKCDDQRKNKELHRSYKRAAMTTNANAVNPNIVYAELACPQISQIVGTGGRFNRPYGPQSPILSRTAETPSLLTVYPPHAPLRTACSCACTCRMYAAEAYPAYTPFHRINMENIFGYYP